MHAAVRRWAAATWCHVRARAERTFCFALQTLNHGMFVLFCLWWQQPAVLLANLLLLLAFASCVCAQLKQLWCNWLHWPSRA